jgi:hypothetical protein
MGEVNPEEQLEIGPGVFKRLGDCTGSEIGQPADDLSDAALTLLVPFKPQATASRSGRRACQRGPNINRRRQEWFLTLTTPSGRWVAVGRHADLTITVAARDLGSTTITLEPIANPDARLLGPEPNDS